MSAPNRIPCSLRRTFVRPYIGMGALLLLCAVALGRSQTLVHELEGDPQDFLWRVRIVGDVNGDGFADIMAAGRGSQDTGLVRVYSGEDGRVLYTWHGSAPQERFGITIGAAGDVDGDGYADLIVGVFGPPGGDQSGSARVYSGRDGSLLHSFYGLPGERSWVVAGAGDVNGDGFADLIVGGPHSVGSPGPGVARVISGLDGSLLHEFHGAATGDQFGAAVAGAGDVNGDGYADLIVGAPFADGPAGVASGRVAVYSGLDGTVLYTMNGIWPLNNFGLSVASAGDVNGDGYSDFIVGAPGDVPQGSVVGMVRVYSGFNGNILQEWFGSGTGDALGAFVAGLGDLTGDGYDDVGATTHDDQSAHFFSGKDGSLIYTIGPDTVGYPVVHVSGRGDVNGDGYPDIVTAGANKVLVFSGREHVVPFCLGDGTGAACPCGNPGGAGEGCASSSGVGAVLEGSGTASLARADLAFQAWQLLPGQPALFFAGVNAVNGGQGSHFGDGLRCAGGDVRRLGVQLPDASGSASFDPSASLRELSPGDLRRYQVWYRDPVGGPCGTGFNLTNGVEVAFSL